MKDFRIEKHNFESAKNEIQDFSKNIPSTPEYDWVREKDSVFGIIDHKVTGQEMNNILLKLQDQFISNNFTLISVVKEFGKVYDALDFLDKEYINGIVLAINNAMKSCEQANQAQADLEKNVQALEIAVSKLKELKNSVNQIDGKLKSLNAELSKNEHLSDIDTIWKDVKSQKKEMSKLRQKIENLELYEPSVVTELNDKNDNVVRYSIKISRIVDKRIKIAYMIAIFSVVFTIGQLVLLLLGIL